MSTTKYVATAGYANTPSEWGTATGDAPDVTASYYDRPRGRYVSHNHHRFQVEIDDGIIRRIVRLQAPGISDPTDVDSFIWGERAGRLIRAEVGARAPF